MILQAPKIAANMLRIAIAIEMRLVRSMVLFPFVYERGTGNGAMLPYWELLYGVK